MARKKKEKFEDDGRVIASMNVDGMPWHMGGSPAPGAENISDEQAEANRAELTKLSKKDTFFMILGVVGAALAVAAVFALGYLAFILVAHFVWFK